MTTKLFLKPGPYIVWQAGSKNKAEGHFAFGKTVNDVETCPNIAVHSDIHLMDQIPPEMQEAVDHWSVRVQFELDGSHNNRTIGEYRFRGATGTVSNFNSLKSQEMNVTGRSIHECVELCQLILAGKIPVHTPHDKPQVKGVIPGVKDATHQLIEAVFIALNRIRHSF